MSTGEDEISQDRDMPSGRLSGILSGSPSRKPERNPASNPARNPGAPRSDLVNERKRFDRIFSKILNYLFMEVF
jgi:hypothetical protein